jgi:hypothetical protein
VSNLGRAFNDTDSILFTLEWIGNLVRNDQGRVVKKIFESKPEGSRRRGRPGLRCLEDIEQDLREMKFNRWRQTTVEREEWASVIKEAKGPSGP